MKFYRDQTNAVYAYESDGSQDDMIPCSHVAITQSEADALRMPVVDMNAEITARISGLEILSLTNRGARELQLRLMEKEAVSMAMAIVPPVTAAQVLEKQPYYIQLKQLDTQIALLRKGFTS